MSDYMYMFYSMQRPCVLCAILNKAIEMNYVHHITRELNLEWSYLHLWCVYGVYVCESVC